MGEVVPYETALQDKRITFVLDSGVFGVQGLELPEPLRRMGKARLFTTIATLLECVRDDTPGSRTQETNIHRLATLLPADEAIANCAYDLYAELRPLRDDGPGHADLYVAAAAIRGKKGPHVVITNDRGDFAEIPRVRYLGRWD
jgi:predicted nucleic acid-binding protein